MLPAAVKPLLKHQNEVVDLHRAAAVSKAAGGDAGHSDAGGGEWSRPAERIWAGVTDLAQWGGDEATRLRDLIEDKEPLDALPRKVRNLLPRTHQHYVRIVLRDMRAAGFAPDEARAVPTRRPLLKLTPTLAPAPTPTLPPALTLASRPNPISCPSPHTPPSPTPTPTSPPRQVGVIISALYRARRPGAVTVRAIEKAWAVLALKAPEFANVDDRIFQLVGHSK